MMKYHERPLRAGEDARDAAGLPHPAVSSPVSFLLGTLFGFILAIGSLFASRTRMLLWWLRQFNVIDDEVGAIKKTERDESRADISDFTPGNNVSSPGSPALRHRRSLNGATWPASQEQQQQQQRPKPVLRRPQFPRKLFTCRIVDIRLAARNRKVLSGGARRQSAEKEFILETRTRPLDEHMVDVLEVLIARVERTKSQCERFLHDVINSSSADGAGGALLCGGSATDITAVKNLCRKLLEQTSSKNTIAPPIGGDRNRVMEGGHARTPQQSREDSKPKHSPDFLDPEVAAAMAAAASIDATTGGARSRYMAPNSPHSEKDLSAEFAFCAYLENIIQILLDPKSGSDGTSAAVPSALLSKFLGVPSGQGLGDDLSRQLEELNFVYNDGNDNDNDHGGSEDSEGEIAFDGNGDEYESDDYGLQPGTESCSDSSMSLDDEHDEDNWRRGSQRPRRRRHGSIGRLAPPLDSSCRADEGQAGRRQTVEGRPQQMPSVQHRPLPPKTSWPDFPVLVRCSEDVPMKIDLPGVSAYGALPINDKNNPIPFETSLFKGFAMIRIAELSSSPKDYFNGKRRKMQVCIQGHFKKKLRFDQVYGGQEFTAPLKNLPGAWLIKWAFGLLKPRLPQSFKCDLFCEKPFFLSPLILTSQKVRADPGKPQYVGDHEIIENPSYLRSASSKVKGGKKPVRGGGVDGGGGSEGASSQEPEKCDGGKARKKALSSAEALGSYEFQTDVCYTFDYYQQFFRAGHFALDLGVKLIDLTYYMGEQPLLLTMAKTMDTNEYLWKVKSTKITCNSSIMAISSAIALLFGMCDEH